MNEIFICQNVYPEQAPQGLWWKNLPTLSHFADLFINCSWYWLGDSGQMS